MPNQRRSTSYASIAIALVLVTSVLVTSVGCRASQPRADNTSRGSDSAFALVQQRGQAVMGVDQYTSAHVFEELADGGRIVLDRNVANDSAGIATIRNHMREVAADFRAGDFTKPFQVHAVAVPGTDVMAARRNHITYEVADRPLGAEVRLRSLDSVAVAAIHQFLAFQRSDHRAAGHEGMTHDAMRMDTSPGPAVKR